MKWRKKRIRFKKAVGALRLWLKWWSSCIAGITD
jgi:hypothetical protein